MKLFIKPVAGRTVRDPETLAVLAIEGELKPKSGYWLKRIKQGDVMEAKEPKAPKTIPLNEDEKQETEPLQVTELKKGAKK